MTQDIAARAAVDAGGVPVELLSGYVEMLEAVSATGRRLAQDELETRRRLGAQAAEQNVPLRALVDLYLSANWIAWPQLPAVAAAREVGELRNIIEAVLRACDDAVVALAEGYESAQRLVMRREEAQRREFIEDLLSGGTDLGRLAERADRFGLRLTGSHFVAVARAERPFADGDAVTRRVEQSLFTRFDLDEVLVTTKDGLLLCIALGAVRDLPAEFTSRLENLLSGESWQVGIGRPYAGLRGISRSYDEARGTLDLADSLGLSARLLNAADLLVFQVLFRDRAAIVDLVATVLTPLADTRGGAKPLLDTLSAFFASGDVAAAAARQLFLSVRAFTYRLDRVKRLTGFDPRQPTQRFTLEAAVLGARLLNWPDQPLPPVE